MVTRDIKKEELAVGQFRAGNNGRMPVLDDPNDRAAVYKMAYPPSAGGLPEELKGTVDESLYAGGITPPGSAPAVPAPSLDQLRGTMQQAQTGVEQMSQPNEALRILQEAIRTKSGIAEQPIGTSDVFKEAGLTGMSSLSTSLNEQTNKFKNDMVNFQNTIKTMSGQYQDMANAALNRYNMAYQQFKDESDRLTKLEEDANNHRQALEILNAQYENSKKLAAYNAKLTAGGYEFTGTDDLVKSTNTIFNSPSGDTYDVAKYAQMDDGTPNPEHIANMNFAVGQMKEMFPATNGKISTLTDMANFINKYYPDSPITADAIANASEKYGIDWETIIATMVAETRMGTDGSKGSREFNFGNVGNTNTIMAAGKSNPMAGIQAGVDAVAKTMALPYYKRNQVSAATGGGDRDEDSAFRAVLASMPTKLKDSEAEKADLKDFVKKEMAAGTTNLYDIVDKALGYFIDKPDVFSNSLRDQFGKADFSTSDVMNIARLINAGKRDEAVTIVENKLMQEAKKTDPDSYFGETTANKAITQANNIEKTIQELDKSPIGVTTGTMEEWLGRLKGKEAQAIKTKITQSVAEMRNRLSGVAVTESEERFLNPLIPQIYDSPANFMLKLKNLQTNPLLELNSTRATMGMPELSAVELFDKNKRAELYSGGLAAQSTSGQPNAGSSFISQGGNSYNLPY